MSCATNCATFEVSDETPLDAKGFRRGRATCVNCHRQWDVFQRLIRRGLLAFWRPPEYLSEWRRAPNVYRCNHDTWTVDPAVEPVFHSDAPDVRLDGMIFALFHTSRPHLRSRGVCCKCGLSFDIVAAAKRVIRAGVTRPERTGEWTQAKPRGRA